MPPQGKGQGMGEGRQQGLHDREDGLHYRCHESRGSDEDAGVACGSLERCCLIAETPINAVSQGETAVWQGYARVDALMNSGAGQRARGPTIARALRDHTGPETSMGRT